MPTPRPVLFIRLTHTGFYADGRSNLSPVLIPDLDVGYEHQDRKVPVYVPPQGHIDINASSRSMLSFEQGGILKLSQAGIITSRMFWVPESFTTGDLPPASSYEAGVHIWNETDGTAYWSDGTQWVAGSRPVGAASGDLSGYYPAPLVSGLWGIPIEQSTPLNGESIIYNSTLQQWEYAPITFSGGPPAGPASGDLGGLYPNPQVVGLQNNPLPSPLADGFLKRNALNTAWEEVGYGVTANSVCVGNDPRLSDARPPNGVAGGSLAGTYPNPTLSAVGTAGTYGSASSVPVLTTSLEGRVTQVVPTPIQITESQVTNLTDDLAAKANKVVTITGSDGLTGGGDLSANRTITMPAVGTAGTYGSATQVPVVTTDAKGRVTQVVSTTITGVTPGGSASGDLSGNYPGPIVTGLQNRPVSDATPSVDAALTWNGFAWAPQAGGTPSGAYSVVTITTNHAASAWQVILADTSFGNLTVTLPVASSCVGKPINIKKISLDGYQMVVTGQGGQTIDGQTSLTVTDPYNSMTVISNGFNWFII